MASDDEIRALAKMALRNKYMLDILFGVANDFACLIEPTLERCCHTGCTTPATITQVDLNVCMCDRHAAEAMVRAQKNLLNEPGDELALLRLRLANEECWVDLPEAPRIRRLVDYVNELRKNDEPTPPTDRVECH